MRVCAREARRLARASVGGCGLMAMHFTSPDSVCPQLLGPGERGIGFVGPSEGLKSKAFTVPGSCEVGIKPDRFIIRSITYRRFTHHAVPKDL